MGSFNKISEAKVVYRGNNPIGGCSLRSYDENTIELKREFVIPNEHGKGIGTGLVSRLIEWEKELGYKKISNYGAYVDMPESLCMGKEL